MPSLDYRSFGSGYRRWGRKGCRTALLRSSNLSKENDENPLALRV